MRVAVLLFAVAVLARSQQPPPTPSKIGDKQQSQATKKSKKATTDKQPTPSVSIIDKAEPQVGSNGVGDKADDKKNTPPFDNGIKITDWVVAGATVAIAILAIIQIGVYCKQAHHMMRGVRISLTQARIANKSAIAAKQSAETARATLEISQRAMVVVDSVGLRNNTPQTHGPVLNYVRRGFIEIVFKNEGATEADEFYYTLAPRIVSVNRTTPPIDLIVSHRTVLQRGKSVKENLPTLNDLFNDGDIASAFGGSAKLEVNGFVRYRDAFNKGWYVGFTSALDWGEKQFRTTMQIWEDGKQPPEEWTQKEIEQ